MGQAREDLLAMAEREDPVGDHGDPDVLAQLRLRATNEVLAEQRQTIAVLDLRARDLGIDTIKSPEELVPLLFAHSVYKSYPDTFVANGQWDRLTLWLDTVSTPSLRGIDMTGVTDVDGWLDRVEQSAGVHVIASSGTTGKNSFFVIDTDDDAFFRRYFPTWVGFPAKVPSEPRRPIFCFAPRKAPMVYSRNLPMTTEHFGRPGAIYTLSDEPMRVVDLMRMAVIRRAMTDGTATPSDVAEFERIGAERAERGAAQLELLTDRVLAHQHEPVYMSGPWAVFWRILELCHERGVPDGSFHPDSVVNVAGGLKGLSLPDDYEDQMRRFLGPVKRFKVYATSEQGSGMPLCEAGVYHLFPWQIPFILDESGEHELPVGDDGSVRGRLAFYDLSVHGHWGGVVSGDQGTMRFIARCECGRPGPVIEDSIVRYSELSAAGDDKLTCGGTIESYIRAAVSE